MAPERRRAGPFETVGAWLRIWTPPRGVEVPPVPWRRLVGLGVPLLAVLAVGAWLVLDAAGDLKRERARAADRADAARTAILRAELRGEQAVRRAIVAPGPKAALVERLERAVLADARRRVARGGLERRVLRAECSPHPRTAPRRAQELDPAARRGRYSCLAVTSEIAGTSEGLLGYPFLAKIAYRRGRLTWCKVNPVPGEQIVPDPRSVVELPRACR